MSYPFENPATAAKLDLNELTGRLLLIKPSKIETGVSTSLGPRDTTVADVHVLDGDNPGEVITDAYIWPRVLQAQLSRNVGTGKLVLGRLGQGTAKPGQNAPWKLTDATGTDQQVARKYLDGLADDNIPF